MAWTTPRTWTTGELVTASIMNAHVRDNLLSLRYISGRINGATGATLRGTGFTSARNSVGDYTITFSVAFAQVPACVATCGQTVAGSSLVTVVYAATTGSFGVNVFTSSGAPSDPVSFAFLAADPG